MKKLFLSFAVIAGLSMISCGNKAENTEVAADAVVEAAVVEEVPADSAAVDTVVAVVEEAAAATAE